jgi:hypothetical protein
MPSNDARKQPAAAVPARQGTVRHRRNIATTAPLVLHDGPRTKIFASAVLVYRADGTPRSISLGLERRQRTTGLTDAWVSDAPTIRLEGDEVESLFAYIAEHRNALPHVRDVDYIFMPVRGGRETLDLAGLAALLRRLSEDPEVFRPLIDLVDDAQLRALQAAVNLGRFEKGRDELRGLVDEDAPERQFQSWFEANPWVFGTEYVSIVRVRDISPTSQIDLLFRSIDGYADIFELKRAGTPILSRTPGRDQLQPSAELNSAFAQAVRYLAEAADLRLYNSQRRDINLYQPRVRLVIGRSNGWDDRSVRTFRDISSAWHGIDILSYDMVLARMELLIRTMASELRSD